MHVLHNNITQCHRQATSEFYYDDPKINLYIFIFLEQERFHPCLLWLQSEFL